MFRLGSRWSLAFAIALVVGATASLAARSAQAQAALRVVAPRAGATLTHMPLRIELAVLAGADTGTLSVLLNGTDISDRFTLNPPSGGTIAAWADDVWGAAFVLEGPNLLAASVELAGVPHAAQAAFELTGDPYADAVVSTQVGANGGFNLAAMPGIVLGPPAGNGLFGGSLHAFSLGLSGEIVLAFADNVIVDGPGVDFTVFENPFFEAGLFEVLVTLFSEAGRVSVSQDGQTWHAFACANDALDHPYYAGCAGVYPVLANGETDARHPAVPTAAPPVTSFLGQQKPNVVVPDGSGGDSFDLADVGLGWARYVRIQAADHVVGPFGPDNAGFDLDAVVAVNAAPEPPPQVPAAAPAHRAILALALLAAAAAVQRRGRRARAPAALPRPAPAPAPARPSRSTPAC
jgi:hypothetical protein